MKQRAIHFASDSPTPTPVEEQNLEIARQAALEGIVLLENDGALPIRPGPIALYGAGARHTVKGGTGSGEVNDRHAVTIEEGLTAAGFTVTTGHWLREYDRLYAEGEAEYGRRFRRSLKRLEVSTLINLMQDPYCPPFGQPITPQDVADSRTDVCVYVMARQAGEGSDRDPDGSDNTLSPEERAALSICARAYKTTILVLNAGSSFDISFLDEIDGINAVVFFAQQGSMGGAALADLLCGRACPSGRLADTWAMHYDDLPFARQYAGLNGQPLREYYREGIYVGYRFFDSHRVAPRYPFGYGLSYTDFALRAGAVTVEGTQARIAVTVTNIGTEYAGQQVVQLYASCPQTPALPKEYQRLAAFAKTKLLLPGESQTLTLLLPLERLASYREADAVTVLEVGDYILRMGNSSRSTRPAAVLQLGREVILARHRHLCRCALPMDELPAAPISYAPVPMDVPRVLLEPAAFSTVVYTYEESAGENCPELDALSLREQAALTVGGGLAGGKHYNAPGCAGTTTGSLLKRGVPNVLLADGPAGLRLQKRSVVVKSGAVMPMELPMAQLNHLPKFLLRFITADESRGRVVYQFATAFPVALALAQTWNTDLLEQVGQAVGREMRLYGVSYWLAPGLNLHRNPLCGRSFEYFSEDPLLSGLFAAALTRGVQSIPGCFVTIKHFACNNQETERTHTDAILGERALRELYLRGFEIAVREGRPGAVMSSYNRLNGIYTCEDRDLLTHILRGEWGFDGLVMTDWMITGKGLADPSRALAAGNDLIMPGGFGEVRTILRAVKSGRIRAEDVRRCAGNVLRGIRRTAMAERFGGFCKLR